MQTGQQIAKRDAAGEAIEQVMIQGDLDKLTPAQRVQYYNRVCESMGLNPYTQPFGYIRLNGKLTLYCKRDGTDQLRKIHSVSILDLVESDREGVYIVTVKAQDKTGRTDMAKGAVSISTLKGENLANAMMKAETKAKRRVTLSLVGLGWLDESEIDSIPGAQRVRVDEGGEIIETETVKAPALNSAPEIESTVMVTASQLETIGRLWTQLKGIGYFTTTTQMQAHLIDHTKKNSRNDLTEAEASKYIEKLEGMFLDAKAKAEEAR